MASERSNIVRNDYKLCTSLSYNCDNTAISARSSDPNFTEHIHEQQTGPKAQDFESYKGAWYSHVLEIEQLEYWTHSCMLRKYIRSKCFILSPKKKVENPVLCLIQISGKFGTL